ncbi:MAG: hypothetical protein IT294_13345 [Deltaproteobacteria bacterium]|nr:hypothetical protein [Deltaproteobacteria bacterium]
MLACMLVLSLGTCAGAGVQGDLDLSYGSDGVGVALKVFAGANAVYTRAVAMQPDGMLVVAGEFGKPGTDDMFVARVDADGELDPTFGGDGIVVTSVGSGDSRAYAVLVQPNGAIVVAGGAFGSGGRDSALVRYLADGTLDSSFGVGGKVITPVAAGTFGDAALAIVRQPDGALVTAGYAGVMDGTARNTLARHLSNGALDPAFGTGGITIATSGNSELGKGLALQSDGKIVLAGGGVERYTSDGTIDTTFGPYGTGRAEVASVGEDTNFNAFALLVDPDDRIFAAGEQASNLAMARWNPSGMIDPTFGPPGGMVLVENVYPTTLNTRVGRQPNGRLLVVAGASPRIWGVTQTGTLDPTFGPYGDGRSTTAVPQLDPGDDGDNFSGHFAGVVVQPDGQPIAAGWGRYYPLTGGVTSLLIGRYEGDGCSGVAAASLSLGKLGAPTGDEKVTLKGLLVVDETGAPVDPAANGIRLIVGEGDLDVTIPGGAGWKTNRSATQWTYKNKAGIQGITYLQLKRKPKVPGQLALKMSGKDADFSAFDDLENVSLVFDVTAPESAQCATAQWPGAPLSAHECLYNATGTTMKCK